MTKVEKIFNRLTWIFIIGGIASGIYSATRGEQPTWLNVFLLYTFCVLSYGGYTLTRHFQAKDDGGQQPNQI